MVSLAEKIYSQILCLKIFCNTIGSLFFELSFSPASAFGLIEPEERGKNLEI